MNKRIAIIGGGMAGLTAAYLLHSQYDGSSLSKVGNPDKMLHLMRANIVPSPPPIF
jgi:thioredoxin reductase